MFKGKRIMAGIISAIMVMAFGLTGFAKAPQYTGSLPPVKLVYYFVNTPQPDLQAVNDRLNELVKSKINATIELKCIDWGAYNEKMNLVSLGTEPWDLCFTSAWTNNYFQNVARGTFAPLDSLLRQYAPSLKKTLPNMFFSAAKVKGKLYGIPNFQQATAGYGYLIQKKVADKDKIDWKAPKKFSDLAPILAKVKKSHPNLITMEYNQTADPFLTAMPMFGFEALGDGKTPGAIRLNDKNTKVVNQFDTKEFKDYINLMRDWYKKGYLRADAATLADSSADEKAGKIAVKWGQIDIDSLTYQKAGMPFKGRLANQNKDIESYDYQFVKPLLTTDKATATLTAINANSKNKERAMMFINLLNTDKEIYNTICWGVEGKHYKKVSQNRIETTNGGGYQIWSQWEFGDMTNSYLCEGDPTGGEVNNKFINMWANLNKNATPSTALGFTFDFTPVKAEKAQCDSIIAELYYQISSGTVDPAKYYPEFLKKLKSAGADKIIAEKQKQIRLWKLVNKK